MQQRFMRRALQLARRGAGQASPNPMVGAVVVKDGEVVGEGYHRFKARHHAEVVALARAGEKARGADLYVTLEPCHHHGRTPPCTSRVLGSGIRRVFVAVQDPNPLVAGIGVQFLRESGLEVQTGCLESEAERLNEAFFHFIQTRRPFVLLKLAQTLDGKIAGSDGVARWITSAAARRFTHRLRYEYDAILVGIETVLRDDPSLDVRWRRQNSILKVVLDSHLRTPRESKVFASGDPVLLFHGEFAPEARKRQLADCAQLIQVAAGESGLKIASVLEALGRRQVLSLLVEGGRRVAAAFLEAQAVERVHFFYAPKILGDLGVSGVGELGPGTLAGAIELEELRVRRYPPDVLIDARVRQPLSEKDSTL